MSCPRSSTLSALAALFSLIALPSAAAPGIVTNVQATLTDVVDQGGEDRWEIAYELTADFAYPVGHSISIVRDIPSTDDVRTILGRGCGWSWSVLWGDPGLFANDSYEVASTIAACSRNLGGIEFSWPGGSPGPVGTHRLVVYDSLFQIVEERTIAVPAPGSAASALAAMLALAFLRRAQLRIRSGQGAGCVLGFARARRLASLPGAFALWLALCLGVSAGRAGVAAAEPVPGEIVLTFTLPEFEITLEATELQRASRFIHDYSFDLRVENLGTPTAASLVVVGVGADFNSFAEEPIGLPALSAGATADLGPVELTINRQHFDSVTGSSGGLFAPQSVELCVMPVPVPGAQLPEADPAIALLDQFATSCAAPNKSDPNWRNDLPQPPKVSFTPGRVYTWVLQTNLGTMEFELYPDTAPQHVAAIIYLVRLGFYDGLGFHRVIQNFVAQGGDPLGNGTGGPGYALAGELDPTVSHDARGVLSTANSGPVTDGSQIFITFAPALFLDGLHTIPGRMVQGTATLDAIELVGQPPGCQGNCPPTVPVVMQSSSIVVTDVGP